MRISPAEVARIAGLARLELSEEKLGVFAGQLGDVLTYMEKLGELDTSAVEPLYSPVEHTSALRPDVAKREIERSEILANAPQTDGQFFIVPKIV